MKAQNKRKGLGRHWKRASGHRIPDIDRKTSLSVDVLTVMMADDAAAKLPTKNGFPLTKGGATKIALRILLEKLAEDGADKEAIYEKYSKPQLD